MRETAPMVLARWKTAAYKSSYEPRKLLDVEKEMEIPTSSTTEEDFKPQRIKMKRGSTSGQTWEVDVGKEWVSNEHQATGKQVASDPLEKNKTRNTAPTVVGGSGNIAGIGRLPEEARQWSVMQTTQLGYPAEGWY